MPVWVQDDEVWAHLKTGSREGYYRIRFEAADESWMAGDKEASGPSWIVERYQGDPFLGLDLVEAYEMGASIALDQSEFTSTLARLMGWRVARAVIARLGRAQ